MAHRKTKKTKFPKRTTWAFQLQTTPGHRDLQVLKVLNDCKGRRRPERPATTMIKDGVRLMWALENNDLSVLFELFPSLYAQFRPDTDALVQQFMDMIQQRPALPPAPRFAAKEPVSIMIQADDEDTSSALLDMF